jgi:D-glycero-beta-D-manno-heptose-7-phosphate kinase
VAKPKAFSDVKVLVVGDLLADEYIYGQTERVSREAPVLIVRHESEEIKLGGGANAAANARSLSAQVNVIGVLGDDAAGKKMQAQFSAQGINFKGVHHKSLVTETRTRILAGGISTSRQQMLRIDRGANAPFPSDVRRELADLVKRESESCDIALVSDYGAGVLSPEVIAALRASKIKVCVDSRFQLSAFSGFQLLKPNEPELQALVQMEIRSTEQLKLAGLKGLTILKTNSLLVTRGKHGMVLFQKNKEPQFFPVYGSDEAVDVTGAGDTVNASLAVALGANYSLPQAVQLANIAGSIVVQKQGTATVSFVELMNELRQ